MKTTVVYQRPAWVSMLGYSPSNLIDRLNNYRVYEDLIMISGKSIFYLLKGVYRGGWMHGSGSSSAFRSVCLQDQMRQTLNNPRRCCSQLRDVVGPWHLETPL